MILPVVAGATAIVLACQGDILAIGVLIAAAVLAQVRVVLRARIARRLWGQEGDRFQARTRFVEQWLPPLWIVFHAADRVGFGLLAAHPLGRRRLRGARAERDQGAPPERLIAGADDDVTHLSGTLSRHQCFRGRPTLSAA